MEKEILVGGEIGKVYQRGHFSKVVKAGGFLFLAGITAELDSQSEEQRQNMKGDIGLQADIIYGEIKDTLEATGSSIDKILKTTTYLTDIRRISEVNEVRRKYFQRDPPASTTVGVTSLAGIADVEIEVVALA